MDVVKSGVSVEEVYELGELLALREYLCAWTLLTSLLKSIFPVEKLLTVVAAAPVLEVARTGL